MTTVYFSAYACHASDLIEGTDEHLERFKTINKLGSSGWLVEGQAYTLDTENLYASSIVSVINHLSIHERRWLMTAANTEGEEIHREAEFWEKHLSKESLSDAMSLVGGVSKTAFEMKYQQLSGFHKALVRYENALIAVQSPSAPGMPGAGARAAEAHRNAIQAYDTLVAEHRAAMMQLAPAVMRAKNRGGAINNAQRGITLAARSQGRKADARLKVADLFQAHRLKSFTQFMSRIATPLALAADGYVRYGNVKSVSHTDGNWHRESYKQVGGFATGAIAGGLGSGAAGLAFKGTLTGLAALGGPICWALIGCIVVVVAGVGYASSKVGGSFGEYMGSLIYDARY